MPQILWIKLSRMATKPRNSRKLSPSKVFRYTVGITYVNSQLKEGLVWDGVEAYTVPGMQAHFDWLLISILMCFYWSRLQVLLRFTKL